jgi:Xaa-Pro aminopeptidase
MTHLRDRILHCQCDVFISCDPMDNAWLTGFFGSTSWLVVSATGAWLLCDFRYIEQAQVQARACAPVLCNGNLDLRLAEKLNDLSVKRAAFEPETLSFGRYEILRNAFSGSLASESGVCRELRMIKTAEEESAMTTAAALTEEAMEWMLGQLHPGMTERCAAALLDFECRKRGAQKASFDTIVLFGERSALPHGMPGDRTLHDGDIVLVDCGCIVDGYCSDLTRTFVFGSIPGKWFSEIYECVRQAQANAVAGVHAGASARAVDAAARSMIDAAGYGEYFGHGTGHGVGLEVHEAPRLNQHASAVLETGMAITVEPGIYLPGRGGVRIEDLLVVTETGSRILTNSSKELRILQL